MTGARRTMGPPRVLRLSGGGGRPAEAVPLPIAGLWHKGGLPAAPPRGNRIGERVQNKLGEAGESRRRRWGEVRQKPPELGKISCVAGTDMV